MQAKAAVAVEPYKVVYQNIEVPDPGPGDIVVRVKHSWISNGTEGSFVRGERIGGDTPRREEDPLPFPHVPGYQKTGVVEWVGSGVHGLEVGEPVFATVSRVSGMFYDAGGHVSPAVTHHSQVFRLPLEIQPEAASGLVLTQVGYNTGMRPQLQPGDAAVVIGDGLVGHWTAQTLRHRGARVMLVGKHEERLSLLEAGVHDCLVNLNREDPVETARAWAKGGIQIVADTVGSIATLESFIPLMKRFGEIVSAGFYGSRGQLDLQKLRDRELTLHAPSGWTGERLKETLELLRQGALHTIPLITHRFPVQRAGEAFDLILSRREPVLGVLLDWE